MTQEQFLEWVQTQDAPYEFDGVRPVAMTGGTRNHGRAISAVMAALFSRLRPPFEAYVEGGVATGGGAVRYPDVLVTCTPGPGTDLVIPNPILVFEVESPTSGHTDRVVKVQEYLRVPSIQRYIILDLRRVELTVLVRDGAEWAVSTVTGGALELPETGMSIPLAELYRTITF